jgi:hypothetical protein
MISYTATQIIFTDDQDRSRPPLILLATATTAEIEAAAAAYFGEAATKAPPDYVGFYSALLGSNIYGSVIGQPKTADSAFAMAVFVSAIQDAMASRENRPAMQRAIWLLLSQIPLDVAHAAELTGLMNQYHLAGVYQLQP